MFEINNMRILTSDSVERRFRIFHVLPNNRDVVEKYYSLLKEFSLEDDEALNFVSIQANFFILASHPLNNKKIDTRNRFRRDSRKYDIRTLMDKKNISFSQNSLLARYKDTQTRQNAIISSMNRITGKKHFSEILDESIYIEITNFVDPEGKEYNEFCSNLINEYLDWDLESDWESSEAKFESFKEKFLINYDDEENKYCFHTFLYECEAAYDFVWELLFKQEITELDKTHSLTDVEKQLYLFMYTRQPVLAYHIPMREEILISFWNQLPQNQQAVNYLVFLFDDVHNVRGKLLGAMLKKLADFCKFYAIWLEIIRLDDTLTPEERIRVSNTSVMKFSFHKMKENKPDEDFQEFINSNNSDTESIENEDTLYSNMVNKSQTADELDNRLSVEEAVKNLPQKQKEVIDLFFGQGMSEDEIASELKISQSAINQRKKSAYKSLLETLKS